MNFINKTVLHKTFGAGIVTGFDSGYLIVDFPCKSCKFSLLPAVRNNFISFLDSEVQNFVLSLIRAEDDKALEAKRALELQILQKEVDEIASVIDVKVTKAIASNDQKENGLSYTCLHEGAHAIFVELFRPGNILAVERQGIRRGFTRFFCESYSPFERFIIDIAGHAGVLISNPQLVFSYDESQCLVEGCEDDYKRARKDLKQFYTFFDILRSLNRASAPGYPFTESGQIKKDIDFFMISVKDVLIENEASLSAIAEALSRTRTLSGYDLKEIITHFPLKTDKFNILKTFMYLYSTQPVSFEKKRAA